MEVTGLTREIQILLLSFRLKKKKKKKKKKNLFIKNKHKSNFRIIHVSDGLPESISHLCRPPMLEI